MLYLNNYLSEGDGSSKPIKFNWFSPERWTVASDEEDYEHLNDHLDDTTARSEKVVIYNNIFDNLRLTNLLLSIIINLWNLTILLIKMTKLSISTKDLNII